MATIGFIGAGTMGAPMVANLVRGGHAVTVYARSGISAERARKAGATLAADLASCIAEADAVITMLPDSPDVESVVLGPDGVLASMRTDAVFVDMSTVSATTARAVSTEAARLGIAAIDAPVSGGESGAIEGTLSVMAGGPEEALARVRPLLDCMASTVTRVGGPGAGQLTKAANQVIVAANIQAVAEAIVLLESSGIDVRAGLTAISGGLAGSTVLDRKLEGLLSGDYRPGFRVELHRKDLAIAQSEAVAGRVSLPVASLVAQLMTALDARGDGKLDHSALLKLTRELNGSTGSGR